MIRIAKKDDLSGLKANLLRVSAVLLGMIAAGILMLFIGFDPVVTYREMFKGTFGSSYGLINSVNIAIPYLIIALGISIAFSMKFWNIGAEGQLVMGAVFATYVTRILPPETNGILLMVLMALAGMAGGAFWALIPGLFKAFSNTNETLFTLMMNYVAIKFTLYLRSILWKDPAAKGFPKIASIPVQSRLPKVFGIHIGWIIALVLVVIVFVLMKYTKKGYETRVVGASENTAHYAGMNVKKVLISGIMLSGAICGLAGMVKLNGMSYTLSEAIGGGDGFTAIIVAWLAQLSAPVMVLVSFLFAALKQGAQTIELTMKIPSSVTDIIQGMILFFALGSEFFIRYRFVLDSRKSHISSSENKGSSAIESSGKINEGGDHQ